MSKANKIYVLGQENKMHNKKIKQLFLVFKKWLAALSKGLIFIYMKENVISIHQNKSEVVLTFAITLSSHTLWVKIHPL